MGVPSEANSGDKWSLDHLFADQDAVPTFVEVKRSTDTRIRREVVAQMLDYAANGSEYWTMDKIRLSFGKSGGNLSDIDVSPDGEEEYWQQFERNLRTGKIRLIFAADEIPMELRRIIEFLNDQMQNTEVIGIEIKQYTAGGAISTLVPRVVGQTTKAMDIKGSSAKPVKIKWTEEMFLAEALKINPKTSEPCKRIIKFYRDIGARFTYSETTKDSVFGGGVIPLYEQLWLPNLYTYKNRVAVEVPFQYMNRPPFNDDEFQRDMIQRLNSIPGVEIEESRIHKRPNFDVLLLSDNAAFERFSEIITDMVSKYE